MMIETSSGKIRGTRKDGVAVFCGIPYAAPPTGNLRFRPPAPHPGWSGVRPAAAYGPMAMQGDSAPANEQSEDCLTLNVWTGDPSERRRPVLVNVHGGAFVSGSGRSEEGRRWAAEDGIVYVSVNYRLGALGFLHLSQWLGEPYRSSGNNGLLDVVAALRWIRENIDRFGGDPDRVTLLGGSAGAKLISSLLTVPAARGLFRGIIAQSGAVQSVRDAETAGRIAGMLLEQLDLQPSEARKLLELPAEDLVAAQQRIAGGLHKFGPVIDGVTIIAEPLRAIAAAGNDGVSLLIGTNRDEAIDFIRNDPLLASPDPHILPTIFGRNADAVWSAHLASAERMPEMEAWNRTLTDHFYRFAAIRLAETMANRGAAVWLYQFDREGEHGPVHSAEWPYVHALPDRYGIPDGWARLTADADRRLAGSMHAAWRAFIHAGDPNGEHIPRWLPFTARDHAMLLFDDPIRAATAPRAPGLDRFPNQALIY